MRCSGRVLLSRRVAAERFATAVALVALTVLFMSFLAGCGGKEAESEGKSPVEAVEKPAYAPLTAPVEVTGPPPAPETGSSPDHRSPETQPAPTQPPVESLPDNAQEQEAQPEVPPGNDSDACPT